MEKDPKVLLSDLINMVKVDGRIRSAEVQLIEKLAGRMGVPKAEVIQLFESPMPSQTLYSEADRISHFYRLALVMQVDQEVHKFEITALKNFGLKMGIRPVVTEQIMNKMSEYPNGIVPPEELLKIFKIYYN